ncbi:unnamed protein product [Paramecium pentaurelia]|uniref:Methyltransferase domain-containing protein n=1 Tax=Paramecium pentaurelia TaxID=43138 RepID=A0A8S1VES2_9CILI|nr:unnamed protein product [Paramecium pentaurelia]
METSTNQKTKYSSHNLIVFCVSLIFSPIVFFWYVILLPITLPLTLILYHYYKVQIKQHLYNLYQDANRIVQNGLKDYIVPAYQATKTKINEIVDLFFSFIKNKYEPLLQHLVDFRTYLLSFELINSFVNHLKAGKAITSDFKNIICIVLNEVQVKVSNNQLVKFVVLNYNTYILPQLQKLLPIYNYLRSKSGIDQIQQVIIERVLQIPINKIQIIGYAILNESGKTVQNLKPEQEIDRYRIQLHQYAITQFWKIKNFKDQQILELECGDAVGLSYITEEYKPQRCLGVDSSELQIQENLNQYNDIPNLKFEIRNPIEIGALCAPNTFDVILGLELKKKEAFRNLDFKSYIRIVSELLKDDGYLIIGDYDTQEEIQKLQEEISVHGLVITEKNDFTVGITQAMKLQIRNIKQKVRGNGGIIAKYLSEKLKPNEKLLQQLKDRQQIYMVFILKKATL